MRCQGRKRPLPRPRGRTRYWAGLVHVGSRHRARSSEQGRSVRRAFSRRAVESDQTGRGSLIGPRVPRSNVEGTTESLAAAEECDSAATMENRVSVVVHSLGPCVFPDTRVLPSRVRDVGSSGDALSRAACTRQARSLPAPPGCGIKFDAMDPLARSLRSPLNLFR